MNRLLNLGGLIKPQYLLRPAQLAKRVGWEFGLRPTAVRTVALPWRLPLTIDPSDNIGEDIWIHGVYDLALTEVLWRLAKPGCLAVDVGANIGYTASIFHARLGPEGTVYAFEPHPTVFQSLVHNINRWQQLSNNPTRTISLETGASDRDGEGYLGVPEFFTRNNGTSSVVEDIDQAAKTLLRIKLNKLDSILGDAGHITVVKIDVEGYELSVLHGMEKLLESKKVECVVFEEMSAYPAGTHKFLEALGYSLFAIHSDFFGVMLAPPDRPLLPSFFAPSYLATCQPDETRRVFSSKGWKSLRDVRR